MESEKERIYIVRTGEVALKGMNRPWFEKKLADRIRTAVRPVAAESGEPANIEVKRHEGLIFVKSSPDIPEDKLIAAVSRVFGVQSVSPATACASDLDSIGDAAVAFMKAQIGKRGVRTFKVETKRADKTFPVKSPEISRIIGARVLAGCGTLKVDVRDPDVKLFIDLRHDGTFLYDSKVSGIGGLPLGTNGKGLALFSGGIDSPVATWMMARRGMVMEAVHFHSYPYTSMRAQEKVERLCGIIASYTGRIRLHIINILPVQEEIIKNCPEEETTVLVRRFMMRIAEKTAEKAECQMLVTGENLGQVASQTSDALVVTDECVSMPVMRPLIGMDKTDIMEKAREIGTFETSIEPYEDCCTVFLPKHPVTRPKLERILHSESLIDVKGLTERAIGSEEVKIIRG